MSERQQLVELLLQERMAAEREQDRIRRRPQDGVPVPLTLAQHRLWVMERLNPGTGLYNEMTAVVVRGPLDRAALQRSADTVIGRHEILRTGIVVADGRPVQVVHDDAALAVDYEDLRSGTRTDPVGDALQRCREQAAVPFDLRCPPLVRMLVAQTAEREFVLAWTMHHIVSDGWSLGVFAGELMAAYRAVVAGAAADLPPLPIQFGDYAVWERQAADDGRLTPSLDYWRSRLADMPPSIDLPTDHPRPRIPTFAGATHAFDLPRDLVESVRGLARDEEATLFMVLLAAFQLLLGRSSGQDSFGVGTPVANRNRVETEGLIGCFMNLLVLRADLAGNPAFRALLRRVRADVIAAFEHGDTPFERLVEDLSGSRDPSRNPLVQVLFVLHNQQIPLPDIPGLEVSVAPAADDTAKFELTLAVVETAADVTCRLEYNTGLFAPTTVRALAQRLVVLLWGIVADPDRRIGFLPFLTDTDLEDLAGPDRQDDDGPPRCLHELFEEQAARTPDAVAVGGGGHVTYRELDDLAERVAARLRSDGARPGGLVALFVEPSVDTVVAILATLKSGAAYVPIDPSSPPDRIRFILEDTGAVLVLTQGHMVGHLPSPSPCPRVIVEEAATASPPRPAPLAARARPGDLAHVIYTSGSTGQPKGVAVEHRQVTRLLWGMPPELAVTPGDAVAQFSSYAFDVSAWEIWAALGCGARLVIVPEQVRRDPERFHQLLVDERVTAACLTPTAFSEWAKVELSRAADELSLRFLGLAGERLDFTRLGPWFARHGDDRPEIWNIFGPTETAVFATARRVRASETGSPRSFIGWGLTDLRVDVVDRHLQPVPVGVAGQLVLSGAGVARGYLGRPELTAERFVPDPGGTGTRRYLTGDLVRRSPDGDLEFLGRIDGQVKLRGYRMELGEVEAALRGHAAIGDSVVTLAPDDAGGHLVAYLVPGSGEPPSVSELRAFLRQSLPHYMVPSTFVYIEAAPRNSSGKVDRSVLPQVVAEAAPLGIPYAPPRPGLEQVLAESWAAVLGVDRVGIDDNFFDLGGHSVSAIHLQDLLDDQRVELEVVALFEHPTIRALAERMANGGDTRVLDRARERAGRRLAATRARAARGSRG